MDNEIKSLVETTLQARIVEAFHSAPEAIDALVQAALSQEVDSYGGKPDSFGRNKMPYLEFLVGDTIRRVARDAVVRAVEDRRAEIEDAVHRAVQADNIVDGLIAKIMGTLDQEYKLQVTFADDND